MNGAASGAWLDASTWHLRITDHGRLISHPHNHDQPPPQLDPAELRLYEPSRRDSAARCLWHGDRLRHQPCVRRHHHHRHHHHHHHQTRPGRLTALTASVSQTAYRTLKQPPLHPPGYVFGPVWTALYATMGYTAYRAYTTGMASTHPHAVALAKVGSITSHRPSKERHLTVPLAARGHALHHPAWVESPVDTPLLWLGPAHRRQPRYPGPGRYRGLPRQRLGSG